MLESYKRILKIDENAPKQSLIEIHEQLATLYGQLGLASDAMSHFSIVVDFYDHSGDQEALLQTLKKVSDLDPNNIETHLKLAELFLAQSREDSAVETLQRLEESVKARGQVSEIVRFYERSFDLFPKDIVRLESLVEIYLKANEPKKALARIQLAFRADPKNAKVLEMLSSTFVALGQPDKARAVDVELLKLYRSLQEIDKASALEGRLKSKLPQAALASSDATRKATPALEAHTDEVLDPADALMKSNAVTAEERKVLSECEVYLKYGLVDKAYEVLSGRLGEFPKSYAIRWKLKNAAKEMQKNEEAIHFLSEIVLLAKTQNETAWQELAAAELKALDQHHPALLPSKGSTAKKPEAPPAPRVAKKEEFSPPSEISLVIDEPSLEDEEEVSAISFQDLSPEVMETNVLSEAPKEMESEILLTDDDFTPEELHQLDSQLKPETKAPEKAQARPSVKAPVKVSAVEEPADELEMVFDQSEPIDLGEVSAPVDESYEIQQGLEEVGFFREQGLNDEAETLLKSLKEKYPHHKDWKVASSTPSKKAEQAPVQKKNISVETLGTTMKMSVQEDERDSVDADFYDLAGELSLELDAEDAESAAKASGPAEIQDIFSAFKKGVAETISEDDWQTHFDLGIAYREMGLFDDAIQEFKLVSKLPGKKVTALYQMGLCEMAKENFAQARTYLDSALKDPSVQPQEKMSVSYDLAEALLKVNEKDKAKKLFEEVQKADPDFREVTERLKIFG